MYIVKKLVSTVWSCVANVYWTTLILVNLPVLFLDVLIRAFTEV
jgi:hypothetical protein